MWINIFYKQFTLIKTTNIENDPITWATSRIKDNPPALKIKKKTSRNWSRNSHGSQFSTQNDLVKALSNNLIKESNISKRNNRSKQGFISQFLHFILS